MCESSRYLAASVCFGALCLIAYRNKCDGPGFTFGVLSFFLALAS